MAKKDLANLVGGIIGKPTSAPATDKTSTPTQETTSTDLDHSIAEAMEITPEMEERLNALRKAKTGRPRGTGRADKTPETRATFVVNPTSVRKLKYIALAEGRLHKEVVGKALDEFISKWEQTNGVINLPNL